MFALYLLRPFAPWMALWGTICGTWSVAKSDRGDHHIYSATGFSTHMNHPIEPTWASHT